MSTIKHSLLTKFGQIYVNYNELGIVFRNGRFARFLAPGPHPFLNPLEEQLVAHFPLEWRSIKVKNQVPARDGHSFNAVLDVQFHFDPNQAVRANQAEMVGIALKQEIDHLLRGIVSRAVLYSLRNEVNQFDFEELRRGTAYEQIERGIRRHLQRALLPLGITFNKPNAVFLETLTPPIKLVQAAESDYRRRKVAQLLVDYSQAGQLALWLDALAQQNGVVYHTQGTLTDQSNISFFQSTPIQPGHNGDSDHTAETYHFSSTTY